MFPGRITAHRLRPLTLLLGLASVLALLVAAPVATAAGNPSCTASTGQALIESGSYDRAIREFTCVIKTDPTGVDGYRGRIEARVLLGRYSDAVLDYQRVAAVVLPVHPDATQTIYAGYDARLAANPNDVRTLTGASFAHWWYFDYATAIHLLNKVLTLLPDDPYGTLFRGSSRMLKQSNQNGGAADLEHAIELSPTSPDVRWLVADAYTYGLPDPQRAFDEASLALSWGLDTPRVQAILGASLNAFGETQVAAEHIAHCIDLVTDTVVQTAALGSGQQFTLGLVPGRVYEIPITAVAGQTISIATNSNDPAIWDTIMVLRGPNGAPLVAADDTNDYFAAIDWVAPATGTYKLRVTSFEAVATGDLVVTRG